MAECQHCSSSYCNERELRRHHYFDYPDHAPDSYQSCPECNNVFKSIGSHWRYNKDHIPKLSKEQKDIVTGLLLGDGTLDFTSSNPRLKVEMISKKYLEYLNDKFGILSSNSGVTVSRSAEQNKKRNVKRGFSSEDSDYNNTYVWRTKTLPELKEFNWYETNKKVWPKDILLSPTVLKHWYIGDGSLNTYNRMVITTVNESDNTEKINKYFQKSSLPEPLWQIQEKNGTKTAHARWTVSDTKTLMNYMGNPLPDFQYKWL